MKYSPDGERDVVFGPNTGYVVSDVGRCCEDSNEETMLVLKIETLKGVENAEAMLANEWVDAVGFGPVDVSVDMGVPCQTDHPDFLAVAERVIDIALQRGIAASGVDALQSRADFERQRAQRVQIFGTISELDPLMEAVRGFVGQFR